MNIVFNRNMFEWDLERCCYVLSDARQLSVRDWVKLADEIGKELDLGYHIDSLYDPEPAMMYVYCALFNCHYEGDVLENETDEYVEMCDRLVDELKPFFIQK